MGYFLEGSKLGGLMRKPWTLVPFAPENQKDSSGASSSEQEADQFICRVWTTEESFDSGVPPPRVRHRRTCDRVFEIQSNDLASRSTVILVETIVIWRPSVRCLALYSPNSLATVSCVCSDVLTPTLGILRATIISLSCPRRALKYDPRQCPSPHEFIYPSSNCYLADLDFEH